MKNENFIVDDMLNEITEINNIIPFVSKNSKNESISEIMLLQIAINIVSKEKKENDSLENNIHSIKQYYKMLLDIISVNKNIPLYKQKGLELKDTYSDDFIICLEDNKKLKILKRHLRTKYNMSLEEYKVKWGLPNDYPSVCTKYSNKRKKIAIETKDDRVQSMKRKKAA